MIVRTYAATDPANPIGGAAFIQDDGEYLPVRFTAKTAEEAGAKAEVWWAAQLEKVATRKPRGRKPKSAAQTQPESVEPFDVI